jgi:hypothetical protein
MNDPYHVYMDLDVVNNDHNSISKPQLRFEETRNTPFLPGDSADYFCSIVRFSIQTGNTLPVFIPKIKTGQSDINRTIYSVALFAKYMDPDIPDVVSTFLGAAKVIYEPEDLTSQTPATPTNIQDLSGTYYYVYNYQHFINLVNKAIGSAWEDLKTNFLAQKTQEKWNQWVATTVVPYIDYDIEANKVTMYADEKLFDSTLQENPSYNYMELCFNDRLYELFASLPFRHKLASTISSGLQQTLTSTVDYNKAPYYMIRFIDRYNNKSSLKVPDTLSPIIPRPTTRVSILAATQEMTSIALWNPVASIVFSSSLLPIVATQTSVPRDLGGNSNSFLGGGNNANLLPILSDFAIAIDALNQYRPMVEYNPGAEYRLIDLNSTTNLNRIDIIVYWKDRAGGLHPFLLQPGCAASVKIMFRRKDFDVGS